jgi:hypothetical protein
MGFADNLRKEMADANKEIIATRFEPRKATIMNIIAEGIRRIGYVEIDTSAYGTGTWEGKQIGVKQEELNAFKEFLEGEGFKVSCRWWGLSCSGLPDMLKITL